MKKILMAGLAAVAISGFSGPASAEVAPITAGLSGTVTADNAFELFVSTDPNSLGTLVASGSDWQSPVDVSIPLDGAYKYYINIIADNFDGPATPDNGNPDALLGQLSVSGNYQFAGGGQTLLTGSTGWTADPNPNGEQLVSGDNFSPVSPLSWTAPTDAPAVFSLNGGSNIWTNVNNGAIGGISTNAYWIWSQNDPTGEAFFQTSVTMNAVPELSTWAMMLAGFAGLGFAGYRRSRQSPLPAA